MICTKIVRDILTENGEKDKFLLGMKPSKM
jgi:hypothetical protein